MKLDYMKKRFTILLILLVCLKVSAQEQLTVIRKAYESGFYNVVHLNNKIIWRSAEQNGINLYASDGTKEGTKLLGNLSSTIPTLHHSFDSWSIYGDELLYNIIPGWDNAQMYHNYSALHFVTNGNDKTIKLFESKNFIEGSSALKIGNDYYYIYGQKENNVLLLKIFKVYPDKHQELVKTIDLSKEDASIIDVRFIENAGDKYFSVGVAPDFLISSLKRMIIDPISGDIINKNQEVYLTSFQRKTFFSKYDDLAKKYTTYVTSDTGLVKLFESDNVVNFFNIYPTDEEIIFYDTDNWWITDGTISNTKYVKSLYKGLNPALKTKFNNGYLFYDLNLGNWQIYANGQMKEPTISELSTDFDNLSKGLIYDNKFYFHAIKWSRTGDDDKRRLAIYAFDGNDVSLAADLIDYELIRNSTTLIQKNGGMLFSITPSPETPEKTLLYWYPTMKEATFIARGFINGIHVTENNKAIIKIEEKQGTIDEDINYKLYISDLKSPAQLITSKIFIQKAVTPEEQGYITSNSKVLGNKLYFSAYMPETGYEPWETDGTTEGTKMIGDLWKGPISSYPNLFIDVDGIPVCQASTPDLGRQLFSLLTKLDSLVLVVPNTQACEGDTITLTASRGFDTYKWIIDDGKEITTTDNKLSIAKSGTYKVIVGKGKATSLPSNAVSIHFIPLPAKPVIKQENNQLSITATGQLQWYLNGTAITGATTNTLTYTGSGDYTVKVTENTCSVLSDKLLVAITSTEELWEESVYPNPASHKLIVKTNQQQPVHLELISIEGMTVLQQTLSDAENEINLKEFNKGVYILKLNQHTRKIIIE